MFTFKACNTHPFSVSQKAALISSIRGAASILLSGHLLVSSAFVLAQAQEILSTELAPEAKAQSSSTSVDSAMLERINAVESMRVVMHAQKPDARLASQLESLFSALGVDNVELRYVEQVPDTIQVRVFHSADGQAGKVVADVLALVFDDVATRALENYQPSPSEGLVEIWLP